MDHIDPFLTIFYTFFLNFLIQNFSGRFDTSGSMTSRLVTKISPLDAFCDAVAAVAAVGIGNFNRIPHKELVLPV